MAGKKTAKKDAQAPEEQAAAAQAAEESKTEAAKDQAPVIPKDVDPNETVVVRNGFQGKLVYHSKRTGERWVWDHFGSEQEIELKELKSARNSAKGFFENNYFMFDEPWVIYYLGVQQYYKNSLRLDQFDEVFKKTPSEIRKILAQVPDGQKKSVAYRAKELIASGEIDSRKIIGALETCLGTELIEH